MNEVSVKIYEKLHEDLETLATNLLLSPEELTDETCLHLMSVLENLYLAHISLLKAIEEIKKN